MHPPHLASHEFGRPWALERGLHGRIVHGLAVRILRGELAPGTTLVGEELEREYGVSRTAVREALKVLAAKGLIDARPRRGTVVRSREAWMLLDADLLRWQFEGRVDQTFLAELAELRAVIEPAAACLAAARHTSEDLRQMREALVQMEAAGNEAETFVLADLIFHRALLAATHNELLERTEPIIEAGLRARGAVVHRRHDLPPSVPAHRTVLDAISERDGRAASAAVFELLRQAARDQELLAGGYEVSTGEGEHDGSHPMRRSR